LTSLSQSQSSSTSSAAEKFRALPAEVRKSRIAKLTELEADALLHDWDFWARPNQREPEGDWTNWLVMAGRGFGKTRVGAEQVRKWVKSYPIVNMIGPTVADVRDVMVRGIGANSAIMEICSRDERPDYEPSKRRLTWPNGAVSLLFTAEDPESLRGPQHMKVWADELASWKRADEAWEQIEFGLRLGHQPQTVITTTPKPTKLIKRLAKDFPRTRVTTGSTYDNRSNLAKEFYSSIITKYEGTRLGRQELNAELLEDNPGALWTLAGIDADRVRNLPPLTRVVVGVDPAVTSGEDSALTGIVIAGIGPDPLHWDQAWPPHYYVIDDLSLQTSPDKWAEIVVGAYSQHRADRIVAEVNNGGDLVEAILRTKQLEFAFKAVHATRGKIRRAEPIAALYEQHRVHHVGSFPALEDQMCDYTPLAVQEQASPDRMDAMVWALWALSDPEEESRVVTHEEQISISPELDDLDGPFFRSF